MKRTLRRWLPIIGAVGVLIALGILLTVRPWAGGSPVEVEEAVAQPAEFGMCNTSVRDIPAGVKVGAVAMPHGIFGPRVTEGPNHSAFFLIISLVLPEEADRSYLGSNVWVDAFTGKVFNEAYDSAADKAAIAPALERLQVGRWEPTVAAWPRTDTTPTSEVVQLPTSLEVAEDLFKPTLKYRKPEAGSGMWATYMTFATLPEVVKAYSCESFIELSHTGEVMEWDVVPEEEEMFQRFMDEVTPP